MFTLPTMLSLALRRTIKSPLLQTQFKAIIVFPPLKFLPLQVQDLIQNYPRLWLLRHTFSVLLYIFLTSFYIQIPMDYGYYVDRKWASPYTELKPKQPKQ